MDSSRKRDFRSAHVCGVPSHWTTAVSPLILVTRRQSPGAALDPIKGADRFVLAAESVIAFGGDNALS